MHLSRTDWLDRSLQLLGEKGPHQLKIDTLCKAFGVTKGSFYHHFDQLAGFITALLEHWRNTYTQGLIEAVAGIEDPRLRGQQLSVLVYRIDMRPERALRAWAHSHPEVAAMVQVVDAERLRYLAQWARQRGASRAQADLQAKMVYAQLLGVQQLQTLVTQAEAFQMDKALALCLVNLERMP